MLDTGRQIDPSSLRLAGSRLTWKKDGRRRVRSYLDVLETPGPQVDPGNDLRARTWSLATGVRGGIPGAVTRHEPSHGGSSPGCRRTLRGRQHRPPLSAPGRGLRSLHEAGAD